MNTTGTEPQPLSLTFAASHEAAIAQSLTQIAHGLERLEDEYEALMIAGSTTGTIVKNRLTHRALQARYTQKTQDWHAARNQLEQARIDAGQVDPVMPYIVQERALQYCAETFTHKHHPVIASVETSQWPDGDLAHTCWVCSGCRKPLGEKTERIDAK